MNFILDRKCCERGVDVLAVALAASLPWSTSASSIFAVLLLLTAIPTVELSALRRVLCAPLSGTPTLLVLLAALGMLWTDLPWADRFSGLNPFLKLLFIPLLVYHFERSNRASYVLIGFLASGVLLMAVSWATLAGMPWLLPASYPGIPVKDYISQSGVFTICAATAILLAHDKWRNDRPGVATALVIAAFIFIANVFYVSASRTALVALPILLFVLSYRLLNWRGAIGVVVATILLAGIAWPTATFMRQRFTSFFSELQTYSETGNTTSVGLRLEYWRKSFVFMLDAPIIGHGTGSIKDQFSRAATGQPNPAAVTTTNPHNQFFALGIQLGLVGAFALLVMWAAHLAVFLRTGSFASLIGMAIVLQNIIGSLFNSHLFDFTQGWGYVIGVGVAGGAVVKAASEAPPQP